MNDAIYGDWGGTALRLWLVRDGQVVDRRYGPGIRNRDIAFDERLSKLVADWPTLPIFLCGMVGARGGMAEAAHLDCPASIDNWRASALNYDSRIRIAPGLACESRLGLPDVMRGEETQLFGTFMLEPERTKGKLLIIMPGTHSKWVETERQIVTSFVTVPTGEIFAILRENSLLVGNAQQSDMDGFDEGVARIRDMGAANLLSLLFFARSGQLRQARSEDWAAGFVSGLLIGAEISQMLGIMDAADLMLVGDGALYTLYARALKRWDRTIHYLDGEEASLAGLMLMGDAL